MFPFILLVQCWSVPFLFDLRGILIAIDTPTVDYLLEQMLSPYIFLSFIQDSVNLFLKFFLFQTMA